MLQIKKPSTRQNTLIIPEPSISENHIIPGEESIYEAYHSIFSWLTSTEKIYKQLAQLCGSKFVRSSSKADVPKNSIYCEDKSETHYSYNNIAGISSDPYDYFQIKNSHGNCFAYALYLAYSANIESPKILIDINKIPRSVDPKTKKQLAYQIYVYNDYKIINWLLSIIPNTLIKKYNVEWKKIKEEEKTYYGIPDNYSFDQFISQFKKLATDINETYKMTWDQVINWDIEAANGILPENNSGISDSKEIEKTEYELDETKIKQDWYMGGNIQKTKSKSKQTTKKNKTKLNKNLP